MTALRVVLVVGHTLFREGLKALMQGNGLDVVGEGSNGVDAYALACELHPDIVLIDLAMPVMGGLEAIRRIKAELPEKRVVVSTISEEDDDLFEAVKAGAQGYLLRNIDGASFIELLHAVARGEPALTPPRATEIMAEFARISNSQVQSAGRTLMGGAARFLDQPLTPREKEVLKLIVEGSSNREIASRLIVSENTIKYHLKNILHKLHLQNRAQIVAYVLREGLAIGQA